MLFYLVGPPRLCNTIKIRVVEHELDVSPVAVISVWICPCFAFSVYVMWHSSVLVFARLAISNLFSLAWNILWRTCSGAHSCKEIKSGLQNEPHVGIISHLLCSMRQ
jgi:hypothetical protein